MNIKSTLALSLATLASLTFSTAPAFAVGSAASGDFDGLGTENVVVNYRSLTREADAITNLVGNNDLEITADVGYAWDDLSFTYVRDIHRTSTLTTDGGYQENTTVTGGTWYRGSYESQADLDADANAVALPRKNMDDYETNTLDATSIITDAEFQVLPKLAVRNYDTEKTASFYFVVDKSGRANYDAYGQLLFLDSEAWGYGAYFYYGGMQPFEIAPSSTTIYGVLPMTFESDDVTFSPFAIAMTIHFEGILN